MALKFKKRHQRPQQSRSVWSTAYVNSLPNACFAVIDENGERHLPYKDKNLKVDLPHLRNALARLNQTQISPELKAKARKKLEAAARQAGVGDYDNDSEGERMTTPTLPADDAALDPLALLQRAQDTFTELADALGYDPLALVERAKKAADDDEDEDEDDEDESDEDDEDAEDEDEDDEEDVPPSKGKPGTGKFAPRFTKKREQEPALTRAATVMAFSTPNLRELAYIPITRRDDEKREIEGVLSNEELDTFGTIFDYDSMKRAVESRWHKNIREQHDPKKAVGKGVYAICDDDNRQVTVRARISLGAEDTWQKILDGTLCGFSIGAANAKTETRMVGDKAVPCYRDFDLAEISVVDAPSNPGAARSGLTIYRSATAVQGQEDVYADFLAADEVAAPTPTLTESASAAAAPSTDEPDAAPPTEAEIAQRVAEAEAALLRGDAFGVPQVTAGTPEANDSGTPAVPTGAELDALDAAMHSDTGLTHVHSHAYTPSTVHMDQNAHHHSDGTQHAHHHMHGHVGHGDGTTPHVHGHEHDHNFQRAAADNKGASGFIAEGDSRVDEYLKLVRREQTPDTPPAVLPAKTAETNGKTPVTQTIAGRTVVQAGNLVAMEPPAGRDGVMLAMTMTPPLDPARVQVPSSERYGARVSGDTRAGMHEGALAILRTCNCPTCQEAISCYDPDNDGDDDVDEAGDTDNDAMLVMPRVQRAQLNRAVAQIVQQQTQPITTQLRQIAARLAGVQTPELTRVQEQLDTVSAVLTALQGQVQKDSELLRVIAEQEQPGAPIVRAAEKTLALHPRAQGSVTPFTDDQLLALRQMNLLQQTGADQQVGQAELIMRQRGL